MRRSKMSYEYRSPITKKDKIFYTVNGLFLFFALLITSYPIIYIASASFSSSVAVTTGKVWLYPVDLSLAGYKAVFANQEVLTGYMNSFIYTVVGTAINVGLTFLAAYPLSRKELVGKTWIVFMFIFTMWFNGGLIPTYMVVRNLGLINTRWALWLPRALSVFNVIIARTYIKSTIPEECFEAASIDGSGYFHYFFRIVLPLSGALTGVLVLFYAIAHWNSYFSAFLYINDQELFPLQIILRKILIQNSITAEMTADEVEGMDYSLAELLKFSLIMVASVPIWVMYPFVQKYFVKGVMIGSVKG